MFCKLDLVNLRPQTGNEEQGMRNGKTDRTGRIFTELDEGVCIKSTMKLQSYNHNHVRSRCNGKVHELAWVGRTVKLSRAIC